MGKKYGLRRASFLQPGVYFWRARFMELAFFLRSGPYLSDVRGRRRRRRARAFEVVRLTEDVRRPVRAKPEQCVSLVVTRH